MSSRRAKENCAMFSYYFTPPPSPPKKNKQTNPKPLLQPNLIHSMYQLNLKSLGCLLKRGFESLKVFVCLVTKETLKHWHPNWLSSCIISRLNGNCIFVSHSSPTNVSKSCREGWSHYYMFVGLASYELWNCLQFIFCILPHYVWQDEVQRKWAFTDKVAAAFVVVFT